MYLPREAEVKEFMKRFKDMSSFPLVVGAVDGCFVDSRYLFRDIFVGWTGKSHDSRVFKNSPLYLECQQKRFLPNDFSRSSRICFHPNDFSRSSRISQEGDSAYSLKEWLMKPYSDRGNLSREENFFNFSLYRSRVVVENAFSRLKGRFQCISKRIDTSVGNFVKIVSACCILHNFCEISNQSFSEEWLQSIDVNMVNMSTGRNDSVRIEAEEARSAIKQYISSFINLINNNCNTFS
ncbi:uncharacterized protein LOC136088009 [Hydra vulgaris]|uniref:Uncharacterized protein LOC136088009 n=1 Tax=Hydra vulgaris TaxID=6087 RepID=A0ABM4D0G3_HYDVU